MTTTTMRSDPANAAQVSAWDGDQGAYWAEHADLYDDALREYHPVLMTAAAVRAADRVVDVGCGTGQTTLDAAHSASSGSALGVDLSSAMLEVARARARARGLRNVEFLQADAQVHPFARGAHDLVLSRTALMFFADPTAAVANLARALGPGGRLVALVWRAPEVNEWIRAFSTALSPGRPPQLPPVGAPGPFGLADGDRLRAVVAGAGLTELRLTPVDRAMYFGRDAEQAHAFLLGQLGWMLAGLDEEQRAQAHEALRTTLREHETAAGVAYASGAWLVEARAGGGC